MGAHLKIVRCDDSHRDAWNDYVAATPEASFYHRYEWRYVNLRSFGHRACYLAALDGERFVGIFPIVHLSSRLFGNVACSLPFVNYGGPCGINDRAIHLLIAEGARVADEWGVEYLEIRSRTNLGAQFPTSEHKVSLTVDLSPGIDAIWKAFKTDLRQEIRRGYKNEFSVRHGGVELLDDYYAVLSEAWRNLGTPIYGRQFLETVATTFPDLVRLCVVSGPRRAVAASFQAYDRGTAEGLWLGGRGHYRQQHPGYILYWEILKDAARHGCQRFHLGRSTVHSGGESFKMKWNAQVTQLYWQYVLRSRRDIPQLNVNNPKYKIAINLWQHLPVAVTTLVGPRLARSIP